MALPSGKHQGRPAVFILGVNVGPAFKQEPHHTHMALLSGMHQGRPAVVILGVNVHPGRNKQPYHRYITRSAVREKGILCKVNPLLI